MSESQEVFSQPEPRLWPERRGRSRRLALGAAALLAAWLPALRVTRVDPVAALALGIARVNP